MIASSIAVVVVEILIFGVGVLPRLQAVVEWRRALSGRSRYVVTIVEVARAHTCI